MGESLDCRDRNSAWRERGRVCREGKGKTDNHSSKIAKHKNPKFKNKHIPQRILLDKHLRNLILVVNLKLKHSAENSNGSLMS